MRAASPVSFPTRRCNLIIVGVLSLCVLFHLPHVRRRFSCPSTLLLRRLCGFDGGGGGGGGSGRLILLRLLLLRFGCIGSSHSREGRRVSGSGCFGLSDLAETQRRCTTRWRGDRLVQEWLERCDITRCGRLLGVHGDDRIVVTGRPRDLCLRRCMDRRSRGSSTSRLACGIGIRRRVVREVDGDGVVTDVDGFFWRSGSDLPMALLGSSATAGCSGADGRWGRWLVHAESGERGGGNGVTGGGSGDGVMFGMGFVSALGRAFALGWRDRG